MGRKSRAKAAHRAAREIVNGSDSTPSPFAKVRHGADVEAARSPMVPPGWTTSPLRTATTARTVRSQPPRPVPTPPVAARRQIYERLKVLVARRDAAQEAVDDEVRALIRQGGSWPAIGQALGVSRPGARPAVPATPGE